MANQENSYVKQDLLVMAHAQNYHRWLLSQFDSYIGNRVLDLGAGIGTYTDILIDRQLVVAVDRETECIKYLREKFKDSGNVLVLHSDIEREDLLSLSYLSIDTIICFNVMEHIQDDSLLLERLYQILTPEGRLLLIVPAYQALYGSIDEAVGHYRRYSKSELVKKVKEAGFVIEKVSRMNSLAVFGWFVVNRIVRKKEQSPSMILRYDKYIIPVLREVEKIIPPPVGLSLVVRAKKIE